MSNGNDNDILSIAVFAAEQLLSVVDEIEVTFALTPFGPIVQIQAVQCLEKGRPLPAASPALMGAYILTREGSSLAVRRTGPLNKVASTQNESGAFQPVGCPSGLR